MKGFVTVVKREINDRRAVLAAAGFAALIPLIVPFAPGLTSSSASDVRGVMALAMGLGLGWIFALFLGSAMVGGDLISGRLGFFFSRPIGGGVIWFGKLIANLFLVFATEVIIFLPALLLSGIRSISRYEPQLWEFVGLAVLVPVLLVLAAHTIGVMWRARSAWFALDAVILVTLAGLLWVLLAPLAVEAPLAVMAIAAFLVIFLFVALVVAGWAQVALGRTDIQRGHRVLSSVLWGMLVSAALVSIGYAAWLTSIEPDDLVTVGIVRPAPQGPWMEAAGTAKGRFDLVPRFLFNRETGAYQKISSSKAWDYPVAFSLDGKRAAWLEPTGSDQRQLVFADLGDEASIPRETPLTFQWVARMALSEQGNRVALFEASTLSVHDLDTGKLLMATRWHWGNRIRLAEFISEDLLKVVTVPSASYQKPEALDLVRIEIVEVDILSKSIERTGSVTPYLAEVDDWGYRHWAGDTVFTGDTRRFVLVEGQAGRWHTTIRNGSTGMIEVDLGTRSNFSKRMWARDGRLVIAVIEDGQGWVEVWSTDGDMLSKWPIGPASRMSFGGEFVPNIVSFRVDLESEKDRWDDIQGYSINIQTGSVGPIEGAKYPVKYWFSHRHRENSDGTLWFNENSALIQWDPVAGTTKHLLGKNEDGGS